MRQHDVEVTVEDAGVTYGRLVAGGAVTGAWLVPEPWTEMVDVARQRAGESDRFGDDTTPVARTPLALALVVDRPGTEACAIEPRRWRCVGDAAQAGARIAWPDPVRNGVGRLALGAVTVGWFDSSNVAVNDFDDAFRTWVGDLARDAQVVPSPAARLVQSAAFFDVGVTTEAEIESVRRQAAPGRLQDLRFLYPEPVISADAVVAGIDGADVADDLVQAASEALAGAGWRATNGDFASGDAPALPTGTNLPSAGVLVALQQVIS